MHMHPRCLQNSCPITSITTWATRCKFQIGPTLTDFDFLEQSDDAHRQVYGEQKHESHFSHELIAGAASFAGMKAWEDHQRKEGTNLHLHSP